MKRTMIESVRKGSETSSAKKDRLENQALAEARQACEYARKMMQIEVERMKKLEARARAEELEMVKPKLVLPVGLLLKVRRVINGEMATLEITKRDSGLKKDGGSSQDVRGEGAVEFKTTGDSGDVHTLLTSENELVDLLDDKYIQQQPTTSDLLRVFSKMIVFEQIQNSNPKGEAGKSSGLRLHAVDEAAEAERIRQWRDKASRIENSTSTELLAESTISSSRSRTPSPAPMQSSGGETG